MPRVYCSDHNVDAPFMIVIQPMFVCKYFYEFETISVTKKKYVAYDFSNKKLITCNMWTTEFMYHVKGKPSIVFPYVKITHKDIQLRIINKTGWYNQKIEMEIAQLCCISMSTWSFLSANLSTNLSLYIKQSASDLHERETPGASGQSSSTITNCKSTDVKSKYISIRITLEKRIWPKFKQNSKPYLQQRITKKKDYKFLMLKSSHGTKVNPFCLGMTFMRIVKMTLIFQNQLF